MDEILELDLAYRRLQAFLKACAYPPARAFAIARFTCGIPTDLQGVAFYLTELAPLYRAALEEATAPVTDPEVRGVLERACTLFRTAGVELDESQGAAAAACGDLARGGGTEGRGSRGRGSREDPGSIAILVPVVQELPPAIGDAGRAAYLGALAAIRLTPRPARKGIRTDRWIHHAAQTQQGDLMRLEDVSASALQAAWGLVRKRLLDSGGGRAGRAALSGVAPSEWLGFDLSLPDPEIAIGGQSAGLGIAVALAGALMGAVRGGQALRPSARFAWSGRMLPTGEIGEVHRESLRAKVRAAYYAGLDGIVVPATMAEGARQCVPAMVGSTEQTQRSARTAQERDAGPAREPSVEAQLAGHQPFRVIPCEDLAAAMNLTECLEPWTWTRSLLRALPRYRAARRIARAAGAALAALLIASALTDVPLPIRRLLAPPSRASTLELREGLSIRVLDRDKHLLRVLQKPMPMRQMLNEAFFLPRGERAAGPWVVASTGVDSTGGRARILGWDERGRLRFDIPASHDTPFCAPSSADYMRHALKHIHRLAPATLPSGDVPGLASFEAAHSSSAVLRFFSIGDGQRGRGEPREPREVFRYYNLGHIIDFRVTRGPATAERLLWVLAFCDCEPVRRAAHAAPTKMTSVACVPYRDSEVHVFPAPCASDSAFTGGLPGSLHQGEELLHFALTGFLVKGDAIDWSDTRPFWLHAFLAREEPYPTVEMVFSTHAMLSVGFPEPGVIEAQWQATGELLRVLTLRAERQGRLAEELIRDFVADSLVALVAAPDSVRVDCNCRDLRNALPH